MLQLSGYHDEDSHETDAVFAKLLLADEVSEERGKNEWIGILEFINGCSLPEIADSAPVIDYFADE